MAMGEPPDGSGRRQRRGWWVAARLLALLLVVGLVVLWVQAPALYGRGDAAKTAAATTRSAILTVAAALIAATAAGAGLYMTARTLAETQRANRASDEREREAQVTDRYIKAISQLGDPQLAIRLGGIYALERIVVDSERDHRSIVEVLSAFVRTNSLPTTSNRPPDDQSGAQPEEQPAPAAGVAGDPGQTLPTDMRTALAVLSRLPNRPSVLRADLTNVQLSDADLSKAILAGFQLGRADLSGAKLDEANLAGAQLGEVDLTHATLVGANLTGAQLSSANLAGARLDGTDLTGARLDGATLASVQLDGADLASAHLDGADLAAAKGLTQQQVDSAHGDEDTKLPAGLRRPAHWSAGPATPPVANQ